MPASARCWSVKGLTDLLSATLFAEALRRPASGGRSRGGLGRHRRGGTSGSFRPRVDPGTEVLEGVWVAVCWRQPTTAWGRRSPCSAAPSTATPGRARHCQMAFAAALVRHGPDGPTLRHSRSPRPFGDLRRERGGAAGWAGIRRGGASGSFRPRVNPGTEARRGRETRAERRSGPSRRKAATLRRKEPALRLVGLIERIAPFGHVLAHHNAQQVQQA
jgi:hypothetical protein